MLCMSASLCSAEWCSCACNSLRYPRVVVPAATRADCMLCAVCKPEEMPVAGKTFYRYWDDDQAVAYFTPDDAVSACARICRQLPTRFEGPCIGFALEARPGVATRCWLLYNDLGSKTREITFGAATVAYTMEGCA